jgi:nitrate reductase / nitrite oxidoreductase, alpha subunit
VKWIKDLVSPRTRKWEEFYRNRWQHDKVVRSTHGVNCTGGCSWNIFVKDGIVTWEMQALDYPKLDAELPPYEPRGCQRGISFSWYLYSPIRVKYPYVRGALLDLWREARAKHDDPVAAWASIQEDPQKRSRYQRARGKGGFRRVKIDEAIEIAAASNVYTIKKYGPDRVVGFSPIPAMSQLSYAGGSRFLQLLGGINLSFYDWYCDLPPASPEAWGEQTDVAESADWYHSKMIAVMGANLNMTRTPDCHYVTEARHNGSKLVVFSPDFSQVAKLSDQWVALNAGQDGAFWMSVGHVILKENYVDNPTPAFQTYVKQYSDLPFLVELKPSSRGYRAGKLLRAGRLSRYAGEENGEWKFLVLDEKTGEPRMPGGSMGHRWGKTPGKWNLKLEDPTTGEAIDPVLSVFDRQDEAVLVEFDEFDQNGVSLRGVPAMKVKDADGKEVLVTTAYDLLLARYGVSRGDLPGEYPEGYDDEGLSYTPAWQERWTGVDRKTVIGFAREWARTAEKTDGKCCIIIGAGINHWYHNNLMYRAGIAVLILTGCVGKNGGGLNHYVGQEKLAPMASWSQIAFGRDWGAVPRLMNAPSWHYVHSGQWRYDNNFSEYAAAPDEPLTQGHTMDLQVKAVKNGWLPFFPQFDESSIEVVKKARAAGCETEEQIVSHVVERLKSGDLKFAVTDPDAPEAWPRTWYIWRGNALMSSAKGHEFFLKHYLGTHTNAIAKERAEGLAKEVVWRDAPEGKLDLIVDLNFRMDTSALYSDIVLPAATWYEKDDLNSTDMHSFIHPLSEAVPPAWESKSDWDLFKAVTARTAELSARHFPEPIEDIVMSPLAHDSPAEIAQATIKDWSKGECEAIPGKTMPAFKVVKRDYRKLYEKFISLGKGIRDNGIGAHGVKIEVKEEYDEFLATRPTVEVGGEKLPSLVEAKHAADAVLFLAPETNGEVAWKGYRYLEERTGMKLTDLAEGSRSVRTHFADLLSQPRRLLNSPCWSGLVTDGRSYSSFLTQVEKKIPWRTLTGRQSLYLDHDGYLAFGEHLPTYKPVPPPNTYGDLLQSGEKNGELEVNYLTPHGKWHIHSTYGDTLRMLTLSRGCEPCWINADDAEAAGIEDNDWVEVHNDNGVVVTRAVVSHRIPRGVCIIYHSPERTIGVPKSPLRGGRRAGGHNSLTRVRLKPLLMVGGYGQFTYHFNYWGPTGVNRETFVRIRRLDKVAY